MSTISEAAERIERHNAAMLTEQGKEIPEYHSGNESIVRDWAVLSREYLRLTDPTPLSPDVLKRVGFVEVEIERFRLGVLQCESDGVGDFYFWRWRILKDMGFSDFIPAEIEPRTLGELRMLAMRLGIELKEAE